MKQSEDIFSTLVRMLVKNVVLPDEKEGKNSSKQENLILLLLLAVLAFVGSEAVKVIFRNNFGRGALNGFKIILCSLIFWVIAYFAFSYSTELGHAEPKGENIEIGYPKTFFFTSIFYLILGFFVLIKGFMNIAKSSRNPQINPLYKGDSYLLEFLLNTGRSQKGVQNLEEPFSVLSIGVFFSGFNYLLGLPLVFCAISVWGYQIFEAVSGHNDIDKIITEKGYNQQQAEQFSEIKM